MGFKPGEENQSSNIRRAIEEAGLDMGAVWIAYFTMGGNAGSWEVEAYIGGALSLPALERDILAQAINELIDDLPPRRRATFSDDDRGLKHAFLDKPDADEGSTLGSTGVGWRGGRSDEGSDGDTRQRRDGGSRNE